ncbi:MAG: type II secretion system protein [Desulfobacterales bacterium]|nr:type II secretion system protein [Desulfobacterales bacterium]
MKPMKQQVKEADKNQAAGFTLVEVMLVIAIFSIAIMGTMSLQTGTINKNAVARKSTLATEYAADTMELLMRVGGGSDDRFNIDDDGDGTIDNDDESELLNDGIDNDGDSTKDEADEGEWHRLDEFAEGTDYTRGDNDNIPEHDYFSGIFNLTWDITDVDLDGDGPDDAKQIDITVTWENGGRELHLTGFRTSVL